MPRRSILSAAERESLLALPDTRDDLIRRYTLSESDLAIIRQRRGEANRLGFAVQLCYLRFPGIVLGVDQLPFAPLLHLVAAQLKIPIEHWTEYGDRAQTRREHLVELQTVFGFEPFTTGHHRVAVRRADRNGDADGQRHRACGESGRNAARTGGPSSTLKCDRTRLRGSSYTSKSPNLPTPDRWAHRRSPRAAERPAQAQRR